MERETRLGTVEWEARDDAAPAIAGYAAVFSTETVIAGLFREQVAPGAFDAALKRDDVRALWNHDPNYVLGRTSADTLRLSVDKRGLRYELAPPDTQWARDLMTSIRRGDVTQSSFAFRVAKEEWEEPTRDHPLPLRTIREVELFDVSPVTYPAYDATSVAARDAAAALSHAATLRDLASASSRPVGLDTARWRLRIAQGDEA